MGLRYNQDENLIAIQDETVFAKIGFRAAYKPDQTGIQFKNVLREILKEHADAFSVYEIKNKPGNHSVKFCGCLKGFLEVQKLMSDMVYGKVEIVVNIPSDESYKGKMDPEYPWVPESLLLEDQEPENARI